MPRKSLNYTVGLIRVLDDYASNGRLVLTGSADTQAHWRKNLPKLELHIRGTKNRDIGLATALTFLDFARYAQLKENNGYVDKYTEYGHSVTPIETTRDVIAVLNIASYLDDLDLVKRLLSEHSDDVRAYTDWSSLGTPLHFAVMGSCSNEVSTYFMDNGWFKAWIAAKFGGRSPLEFMLLFGEDVKPNISYFISGMPENDVARLFGEFARSIVAAYFCKRETNNAGSNAGYLLEYCLKSQKWGEIISGELEGYFRRAGDWPERNFDPNRIPVLWGNCKEPVFKVLDRMYGESLGNLCDQLVANQTAPGKNVMWADQLFEYLVSRLSAKPLDVQKKFVAEFLLVHDAHAKFFLSKYASNEYIGSIVDEPFVEGNPEIFERFLNIVVQLSGHCTDTQRKALEKTHVYMKNHPTELVTWCKKVIDGDIAVTSGGLSSFVCVLQSSLAVQMEPFSRLSFSGGKNVAHQLLKFSGRDEYMDQRYGAPCCVLDIYKLVIDHCSDLMTCMDGQGNTVIHYLLHCFSRSISYFPLDYLQDSLKQFFSSYFDFCNAKVNKAGETPFDVFYGRFRTPQEVKENPITKIIVDQLKKPLPRRALEILQQAQLSNAPPQMPPPPMQTPAPAASSSAESSAPSLADWLYSRTEGSELTNASIIKRILEKWLPFEFGMAGDGSDIVMFFYEQGISSPEHALLFLRMLFKLDAIDTDDVVRQFFPGQELSDTDIDMLTHCEIVLQAPEGHGVYRYKHAQGLRRRPSVRLTLFQLYMLMKHGILFDRLSVPNKNEHGELTDTGRWNCAINCLLTLSDYHISSRDNLPVTCGIEIIPRIHSLDDLLNINQFTSLFAHFSVSHLFDGDKLNRALQGRLRFAIWSDEHRQFDRWTFAKFAGQLSTAGKQLKDRLQTAVVEVMADLIRGSCASRDLGPLTEEDSERLPDFVREHFDIQVIDGRIELRSKLGADSNRQSRYGFYIHHISLYCLSKLNSWMIGEGAKLPVVEDKNQTEGPIYHVDFHRLNLLSFLAGLSFYDAEDLQNELLAQSSDFSSYSGHIFLYQGTGVIHITTRDEIDLLSALGDRLSKPTPMTVDETQVISAPIPMDTSRREPDSTWSDRELAEAILGRGDPLFLRFLNAATAVGYAEKMARLTREHILPTTLLVSGLPTKTYAGFLRDCAGLALINTVDFLGGFVKRPISNRLAELNPDGEMSDDEILRRMEDVGGKSHRTVRAFVDKLRQRHDREQDIIQNIPISAWLKEFINWCTINRFAVDKESLSRFYMARDILQDYLQRMIGTRFDDIQERARENEKTFTEQFNEERQQKGYATRRIGKAHACHITHLSDREQVPSEALVRASAFYEESHQSPDPLLAEWQKRHGDCFAVIPNLATINGVRGAMMLAAVWERQQRGDPLFLILDEKQGKMFLISDACFRLLKGFFAQYPEALKIPQQQTQSGLPPQMGLASSSGVSAQQQRHQLQRLAQLQQLQLRLQQQQPLLAGRGSGFFPPPTPSGAPAPSATPPQAPASAASATPPAPAGSAAPPSARGTKRKADSPPPPPPAASGSGGSVVSKRLRPSGPSMP